MKPPVKVLDRITSVSPLGVRFWDEVAADAVSEGLVVTAYPRSQPGRRVRAVVNSSGVFVFHHLPGLRDVENGPGDADYWANVRREHAFLVEVVDMEDRFLPLRLFATPPVRGLLPSPQASVASPLSPPSGPPVRLVTVYSSPTRAVPAGMAVVRATLSDPAAGPAAWAVLEAYRAGVRIGRGIADRQGQVALLFPYPEPVAAAALGSPLAGDHRLTRQSWAIELRARYQPPSPPRAASDIPDIQQTLDQRGATLWADTAQAQQLPPVTLWFGRELVVRSRRAGTNDFDSTLWITPT